MILRLAADGGRDELERVLADCARAGRSAHHVAELGCVVVEGAAPREVIAHRCVVEAVAVDAPYQLASRAWQDRGSRVALGHVVVGDPGFVVVAALAAPDSQEQLLQSARAAVAAGADAVAWPLAGAAARWRVREEAPCRLRQVAQLTGQPALLEVDDVALVPLAERSADGFVVAARNMQNFELLRALGRTRRPVILQRSLWARLEELLLAAEYVLAGGNRQVALCEAGVRGLEPGRGTLDVGAIAELKRLSHLPVMVNLTRAAHARELVSPLARAAVAAGADGALVDLQGRMAPAATDGAQPLTPAELEVLLRELDPFLTAAGRATRSPMCWTRETA